MAAKHVRGGEMSLDFISSGTTNPGQIITVAGKRAVYNGAKPLANGEYGRACVDGIWDVDAASAATFSAGAIVDVELDDSTAIADGASGTDGYLGIAVKAKVNGETTVRVWLNAPPAQ